VERGLVQWVDALGHCIDPLHTGTGDSGEPSDLSVSGPCAVGGTLASVHAAHIGEVASETGGCVAREVEDLRTSPALSVTFPPAMGGGGGTSSSR